MDQSKNLLSNSFMQSGIDMNELSIIQQAATGLAVLDKNRVCVLWNKFMETLTGMPSSLALGKTAKELIALTILPITTEQVNELQQGGISILAVENGRFQSRMNPLKNNSGVIIGLIWNLTEAQKEKAQFAEDVPSQPALGRLVEGFEDLWWLIDPEMRLVSFSEGYRTFFKEWLKFEPEIGMNLQARISGEGHPDWEALYKKALSGITFSCSFKYGREGKPEYSEIFFLPVFENKSINHILVYSKNVSRDRIAEADYKKTKERITDLYDNAPCGYHCVNVSGLVIEMNQTELNWLGYTREEVIGKMNISELQAPSCRGSFQTNIEHIEHNKGARDVELEMQRKDGSTFFVMLESTVEFDAEGHFLNTRATLSDITEKKKALDKLKKGEIEIKAREAFFKTLIESSSDLISVVDSNLLVEFVSPSVERLFGYKPEEILGKFSYEHIHPDDIPMIYNTLEQAATRPGEIYKEKYRYMHKDGSWKFMEGTGRAWFRLGTNKPLFIINSRDISDHIRVEQQLQYKVNELNTFMYKATHDLRAPLSSLLGLITMAKGEKNKKDLLQYFEMIDSSTRKMDKILIDLVDIIKITQGIPEITEIHLEDLLRDVLISMENSPMFKNITITQTLELTKPFYSDPKLLRSILQNILDNSAKYRSTARASRISINIVETITGVQIMISDNGIGIPEQLQEKVFHMFYRATSASSGTGLGLYIVKNSIEKLSGSVELKSIEGEGTFISIMLPSSCLLKEKN
jgi:PAS domain S-box-containing protein